MLGLSRCTIRQLIAGGFVTPGRGRGNAWQFDFRDIVLLRVAHDLRAGRIPTRRIMRSLARLRAGLPDSLPLSGLRIKAVGDQVAVRRRRETWDAETGQLLIDLDLGLDVPPPAVTTLAGGGASTQSTPAFRGAPPSGRTRDARGQMTARRDRVDGPATDIDAIETFLAAEAAEDNDRSAAERGYRRAIERDPTLADAILNLSALLCDSGRFAAAMAVLDQGLRHRPDVALLHFNRGVALEDLGRQREAIASYEASLRVDPSLADAHYNLARLHELAGDRRRALRHLSSYRRLT